MRELAAVLLLVPLLALAAPVQLYAGDSLEVQVTARKDGAVFDLTDCKLVASLARSPSTVPALTKRSALAGGGDAQVAITDAAEGQFSIYLRSADTAGLRGAYTWDVVAQTTDGEEHTVYQGQFEFLVRITQPIP